MAIRNPTVLYAPVAERPSPIEILLQLVAFAYQEPPRMSFTLARRCLKDKQSELLAGWQRQRVRCP